MGFAFATGPYFYFDTQYSNNSTIPYQNLHGLSLNTSIGAIVYTWDPLLLNVSINRIQAINSFDTNTIFLGASWDLDKSISILEDSTAYKSTYHNQVTALYGHSMVDGKPVVFSKADSVEYHYVMNSHYDLSLSYLNEGKNKLDDRNGISTMIWIKQSFYQQHLTFSAGAGPYYFKDQENPDRYFAGIFGLASNIQLMKQLFARFEWDRTLTTNNRDSDIYLLGLGVNF